MGSRGSTSDIGIKPAALPEPTARFSDDRHRRPAATPFKRLTVAVVALSAGAIVMTVVTRGDTGGWNVADDVAQSIVAFVATIACAGAARRGAGRYRTVWTLLAAGTGLWCVGQIHWTIWETVHHSPPSTPSVEDVAFLGSSICYVVGVLLLVGGAAARFSRARAVAEGLMIAGGLSFLTWPLVLDRVWNESGGVSVVGRLVLIAYPALDLVVLAVLLFALERGVGAARTWIVPLGLGIAAIAIADGVYACFGAHGVQPNDAG